MNTDYYYFGEFGFFNLEILGSLHHLFNLDTSIKINIHTFNDYANILNILYSNNINTVVVNKSLPNIPNNRSGHNSCIDEQFAIKGMKNLMEISKCLLLQKYAIDEFRSARNTPESVVPRLFYRSTPIKFTMNNLNTNNIVCICPRYRQHFAGKNLLDNEWKIILDKIITKKPDANIIALGKKEELLELNNIIYANDIYEHIHYLNHCDFAVFPDSGMAEFAINCGCKNIKVIYKKQFYNTYSVKTKQPKPLSHGFNPFNLNIEKYTKAEYLIC